MKITSINVKNYRCLRDVFVPLNALTVLVGTNGTGKSCLLSALKLFYNTNIKISERDYYGGNTSEDISITVHFSDLTDTEKKLFRSYLEGDELSVEKVIKYDTPRPLQKYHGTRYKNSEFEAFRNASGGNIRAEYDKLRGKDDYKDFPPYQNKEVAKEVFAKWELANKDRCKRCRDDGEFFGFQNVGTYRLEKYSRFIHIPAVQEASEESTERKGSIFEEVMEIVVKSALATNEDLVRLEAETQQKYKKLIDPSKNKNLKGLEKKITETLNYFVHDSEVKIQWIEETGIQINPPRAYVTLMEGGYENTVDRCGHGLQRAYVLSLFQELAFIQASTSLEGGEPNESSQSSLPSLIIGIEEPELYQHPDRQRHFAQTLLKLSSGGIERTIANIQIIYSTHAPLMIDFQRFNELRIFRKIDATEEEKPKETNVTYTNLSEVSRLVEKAKGLSLDSIGDEELRQRLISLMNPWMNEGFFASLVVLVEGIRDRALILGEAFTRALDFESKGICIIPCSGKDSMTEAIAIYNCLKIPAYVVWDSDEGKAQGRPANKNILRCLGCAPEDYPCKLTNDFCCTKTNLEQTFREEIGSVDYERVSSRYCRENNLGKLRYAMENPYIVSSIIGLLKKEGYHSNTLKEIVDKISEKYNAC